MSSLVVDGPMLTRIAARAISGDSPMAASTGLAVDLARRAGRAGADRDAGEIERGDQRLGGATGERDARRVGEARVAGPDDDRAGVSGAITPRSSRSRRPLERAERVDLAARGAAAAAPKPAIAATFSVPARRPRS